MTKARHNRPNGGTTAIKSMKYSKRSVGGSSVLCGWNPWLMPDKTHTSDLICILHVLLNLLLWTTVLLDFSPNRNQTSAERFSGEWISIIIKINYQKLNCTTICPINMKIGVHGLGPKCHKHLQGHLRFSKNMAAIGRRIWAPVRQG